MVKYVQWAFNKSFLKHLTLTLALELKKDLGKRWMGRWELMRRGPSLLIDNSYPYWPSIQGERSQMGTDWIHLGFPLVWIKQTISIIQFVPAQEGKVMVTHFNNSFEKASSTIYNHTMYSATVSKNIDLKFSQCPYCISTKYTHPAQSQCLTWKNWDSTQ